MGAARVAHRIGVAALHALELTLPASLSVHDLADYARPWCAAYGARVMKAFHVRR